MKQPTLLAFFYFGAGFVVADDWPTYQHDNQRTAVTSETLAPEALVNTWTFDPPHPPAKGWPRPVVGYGAYKNKSNVDYDDAYHVTVAGNLAYFSASAENRVYALDVATGRIVWSFFTDAAPRLAPALWEGRAYFGADDGMVYCLNATDGSLVWSFDAAPGGEQLLGQGRLGSIRPVRSGVLIEDGAVYFAAGLFPAEGVYLFSVDGRSGKLRWRRALDGRGNEAPSPQGYLLSDADSIFITSRIEPSRWSKADGREMPFVTPVPQVKDSAYRYHNGGSYAQLWDGKYLVYGQAAMLGFDPNKDIKDKYGREVKGERLFNWFNARRMIFRGQRAWLATDYHLLSIESDRLSELAEGECLDFEEAYKKHNVARCRADLEEIASHGEDSGRGKAIRNGTLKYALPLFEKWPEEAEKHFSAFESEALWMTPAVAPEAMVLAGDVLFAGGETGLVAADADSGAILWKAETGSRVRGLAVANQRLFVSTIDGKIRCYAHGTEATDHVRISPVSALPIESRQEATAIVEAALPGTNSNIKGLALLVGGDTALAAELIQKTDLRIKILEADPGKLAQLRHDFSDAGWYGGRITVSPLEGPELPFAPYLFNLALVTEDERTVPDRELLRVVRPFGGVVFLPGRKSVSADVTREFTPQQTESGIRLRRGALVGGKNWTHNYGSPANRYCSDDELVHGPFGILWFGEPGPRKRIERHATPPMPLVVDGTMFLEGYDLLMAYDVYNGTKYWERWIPGVTRQGLPVATSNLVADKQHLYAVADYRRCLQLDARTGESVREFSAPILDGHENHYWGWIAKIGNTLFGSRPDHDPKRRTATRDSNHAVFALDASTGKQKWIYEGEGIDNDSIAIDEGVLYLADRALSATEREQALASTVQDDSVEDRDPVDRRGNPIALDLRKVVALNAETGAELWSLPFNFSDITLDDSVIGSHIGHSVLCMVRDATLVVSGQGSLGHPYREYQNGEFARRAIYAFDSSSGKLLWGGRKNYRKRPIVIGDYVYAEPHAWKLRTGEQLMTVNPLNGQEVPMDFLRGYSGCGHLVASGTALFGNAGSGGMAHYNLEEQTGYTPFGNLQLACGTGAVPAGGVFVAPEGRSGCTCATPIHTSIVLYPGRKRTDAWSFSAAGSEPLECLPIQQVAVNLGAPGFRTSEDDQLWLPYAGKGFHGHYRGWLPSYQHQPEMFFAESADLLRVQGSETPWIYTSGYTAEKALTFPILDPNQHPPASYTVRLHFAEPEEIAVGERVFEVTVQGKVVLPAFDIVARAGSPRKAIVKEFTGIEVKDTLQISLKKLSGERPPVLCGFEVVKE